MRERVKEWGEEAVVEGDKGIVGEGEESEMPDGDERIARGAEDTVVAAACHGVLPMR